MLGGNIRQGKEGVVIEDRPVGLKVCKGGSIADGTIESLVAPRAIPLRCGGETPDRVVLRRSGKWETDLPIKAMPVHQVLGIRQEGDGIQGQGSLGGNITSMPKGFRLILNDIRHRELDGLTSTGNGAVAKKGMRDGGKSDGPALRGVLLQNVST